MKYKMYSYMPPRLFAGKSLLIIIVIIISAFSFSLGYLVGKKNENFTEKQIIGMKKEAVATSPPVSPDDFDKTLNKKIKEDLDVLKNNQRSLTGKTTSYQDNSFGQREVETSDGSVYTIQVGAFKKIKDAKKLNSQLVEKGFTSYLVTVKLKKGDLYKVRVGRFNSRGEAEQTSSEIRKIRGLDPFILINR